MFRSSTVLQLNRQQIIPRPANFDDVHVAVEGLDGIEPDTNVKIRDTVVRSDSVQQIPPVDSFMHPTITSLQHR